jgi:hypothetical protein
VVRKGKNTGTYAIDIDEFVFQKPRLWGSCAAV